MAWVRYESGFPRHHKIQAIPSAFRPAAIAVHVAACAYSAEALTDGFIPDDIMPALTSYVGVKRPKRVLDLVTNVGLFRRVSGGYEVNDYTEYNPDSDTVRSKREADKARKQAERAKRSDADGATESARNRNGIHGESDESSLRAPARERTPAPPVPLLSSPKGDDDNSRSSTTPPEREDEQPAPPTADAAAPKTGLNLPQDPAVADAALAPYRQAKAWLESGGYLEPDWRLQVEADFGVDDPVDLAMLTDHQHELADQAVTT